jgi:uncharacterized membrane protein YhhN
MNQKRTVPGIIFTGFYCLVAVLAIAADSFGMKWLYIIIKPVPVLMLLFLVVSLISVSGQKSFMRWITGALIFSVSGDVLLIFAKGSDLFFMAGLLAFLIAHLSYISAFVHQIFANRPWNQHWGQLAFSTLVVVYGAEFFILNRNSFATLEIPVLFYCIAITAMGVAATMRNAMIHPRSYFMVLGGAMLFVISDSLLATAKFITPFPFSGMMILGTYYAAQYFLITGCMIDVVKTAREKQNTI